MMAFQMISEILDDQSAGMIDKEIKLIKVKALSKSGGEVEMVSTVTKVVDHEFGDGEMPSEARELLDSALKDNPELRKKLETGETISLTTEGSKMACLKCGYTNPKNTNACIKCHAPFPEKKRSFLDKLLGR